MDDNNLNHPTTQGSTVETKAVESGFTINETTIMAALSYFGPLVLVPFLTKRDDAFVKFHIKQGIVLLIPLLFVYVFGGFLWFIYPVIMLMNLAILALAIYGIVKALQHKEEALPFIGQFATKINI